MSLVTQFQLLHLLPAIVYLDITCQKRWNRCKREQVLYCRRRIFHHQQRILLTLWASDSKSCNSGRRVFLDETRQTGNSYTSVPAHRKSQLQMWRQTRWMTQGMWKARQSSASLKRGPSKAVGHPQLCAAAPLNVSGWPARTAPTCPLRPSLWFDAQSCLLIDLHLPAVVACGRVCIAFALLSPRAVRLSDKSVQRREKKWYTRRDVSTPAVVVAGGQCLTALCFTPSPLYGMTSRIGERMYGWLQDMKRTWRATGSSSWARGAPLHMSVTHLRCQDQGHHLLAKRGHTSGKRGFVHWTCCLWSCQGGSLWAIDVYVHE